MNGLGGHIIADGGCKEPWDIVKAFGAGADFVMLGTMLAGTDECEGEWKYEYETPELNHITNGNETGNPVSTNERLNKQSTGKKTSLKVYGMASQEALNKYNNDQDYRPAEGLCSEIPYKGPVKNVIKQILGGLRSACTYVGSSSLKDLPKCITFVKVNRTK